MASPKGSRAYNCWTPEEEDCLRNGVTKHGLGSWEIIRRDPEFYMLERRSGVQLKDKWRNLVKFRHISVEESRTLKPKTSGPWSRKHSACGPARERSRSPTPPPSDSRRSSKSGQDQADEEHAATLLALEGTLVDGAAGVAVPFKMECAEGAEDLKPESKRISLRLPSRSRAFEDYETALSDPEEPAKEAATAAAEPKQTVQAPEAGTSGQEEGGSGAADAAGQEDGEGGGALAAGRRKKRRLCEDRRFGIYDQRRYGPGGVVLDPGPGGRASWGRKSRGGPRCQSEDETDISDEEGLMEEDDDDDEEDGGERRRRPARGKGLAGKGGRGGGGGRTAGARPQGGMSAVGCGADILLDGSAPDDGPGGLQRMYIVSCPCGTTYDDGAAMIECKACGVWAHAVCLHRQCEVEPLRYNFEHYKCEVCQLEACALAASLPSGPFQMAGLGWEAGGGAGLSLGVAASIVAAAAPAPPEENRRPRRERKANARYHGGDFAPLEELERGLDERGAEPSEGAPQPAGSGGSQHSSKSSRDKTNEASTSLLGLTKLAGSGGAAMAARGGSGGDDPAELAGWGAVLGDGIVRGPSRTGSRCGGAGRASRQGGRRGGRYGDTNEDDEGAHGSDQLDLFMSHASGRGGSSSSLHREMMMLSRGSGGGYPGRSASPATAALAAAAAIAMKEHEAETLARASAGGGSGNGGGSGSGALDPFSIMFPDSSGISEVLSAGGSGGASRLQNRQLPVAPLARKASAGSLPRMMGPSISPRPGALASGSGGLLPRDGGAGGLDAAAVAGLRPPSSLGMPLLPSLSQHHHQQLLASLGLDCRSSSPFNSNPSGAGVEGQRNPGGSSPSLLQQHPHLARMAALQNGVSPRGSLPLQNVFGESDDEGSLGLLDSLRSDAVLMSLLGGGGSRAATPASQLLLDSLMRATPDFLAAAGGLGGAGQLGSQGGSSLLPGSAGAALPLHSPAGVSRLGPFAGSGGGALDRPGSATLGSVGHHGNSVFQSVLHQARASHFGASGTSGVGPLPPTADLLALAQLSQQQQQQQQELAQLRSASAALASSSSSDLQLLLDLLRPGTPEAAWALLRGSTPTPLVGSSGSDAMAAALGMLSAAGPGSGESGMAAAAASWLLTGRRSTPLPPPPLPPPAVHASANITTEVPCRADGDAKRAARGEVGAHLPQDGQTDLDLARTAAAAVGGGVSMAAVDMPALAALAEVACASHIAAERAAAMVPAGEMCLSRPVAAPVGSRLPSQVLQQLPGQVLQQLPGQVLQQAGLQARSARDDVGEGAFNVDALLRENTPVGR